MILSIILVLWVVVVTTGTYLLEEEDGWSGLYLSEWVMIVIVLLVVFIVFNAFFLFHPSIVAVVSERGEEFIQGKRVYEYIYPEGEKEGVFSKTYVPVDDETLVRIKILLSRLKEEH